MSDDRDDIDAALRRAMAALDGEAPAGYFEALPARTLARLDDPALGAALAAASGELPEEPAQPLRAVQDLGPPPDDDDDDDAVYSSQIMNAVELLEPAPRGARPRRDQASESSALMRGVEEAADGDARGEVGAEPAFASSVRVRAVPVDADGELGDPGDARVAGPDLGVTAARSRIPGLPVPAAGVAVRSPGAAASATEADRGRRRRRMRAAIAGIGAIGIAAVAMMYLRAGDRAPRNTRSGAPAGPREALRSAPSAASPGAGAGSSLAGGSAASGDPVARQDTVTSAKPAAAGSGAASGSSVTPPEVTTGSGPAPGPVSEPGGKLGELVKRPGKGRPPAKGGGKPEVPLAPGTAGKGAAKQAGVDVPRSDESEVPSKKVKSPRPRPDRTSLSSDDIERAMTAIAGQARACVAGTGATASLRLTVAPSGRIAQVAVTGPLAGMPAGTCLERAVQAATFPPWSGAAQSFDYSYSLSN